MKFNVSKIITKKINLSPYIKKLNMFKEIFKQEVKSLLSSGKVYEWNKDWKIIQYWKIDKETIETVKIIISEVLKKFSFIEENPKIKITTWAICSGNWNRFPAFISEEKSWDITIFLSIDSVKNTSGYKAMVNDGFEKTFSVNANLAMYTAHEATHYVQIKKNVPGLDEIITNRKKHRSPEIMDHSLEKEADETAHEIVKKIFNIDLSLG